MIVSGTWLAREATQRVLSLLSAGGYQAFAVGGCVRNELLGAPVSDVDVATDAHPQDVVRLAGEAGIKSVPTGIDHGTITLVADSSGYQVTTFRRDIKTDGRRATVQYSKTVEEDAKRRDFTMNALYVRADGTLLDPIGGLPDVRARRLRFIGKPTDRIREDYLRILRFFRLFAWYGDPAAAPDPAALAACKTEKDGIERLSDERISSELRKLLAAPNPVAAITAMTGAGVLGLVLPGAAVDHLEKLVVLEASENGPATWQRRLICLGGDTNARRMRLSKAEARRLKAITGALASDAPAAENAYQFGAGATLDAAFITAAKAGRSQLPASLEDNIELGARAKFPVTAGDLLPSMPPGPELGKKLKALRTRWISSGFSLSREDLLSD